VAERRLLVRYIPSLREQIRVGRAVRGGRPVVIRSGGSMVERVDPATQKTTGEPQQFRLAPNGALTVVPKTAWVSNPTVIDVGRTQFS
jgi:hypothetical protein